METIIVRIKGVSQNPSAGIHLDLENNWSEKLAVRTSLHLLPIFSYHRLTCTTSPALQLPTALKFICCLGILHPFFRGWTLTGSARRKVSLTCPFSLSYGSHIVVGKVGVGQWHFQRKEGLCELDNTQSVSQRTLAICKPRCFGDYLPSHRRESTGVKLVQRWPV